MFELLDNAELRVLSPDRELRWQGRIDDLPVIEVQPAQDGSFAVVLLDPPMGAGAVDNLVRINSDASVSWRAELPPQQGADSFVSFKLESAQLVTGVTWSGFRVRLSAESGKIVDSVFTK